MQGYPPHAPPMGAPGSLPPSSRGLPPPVGYHGHSPPPSQAAGGGGGELHPSRMGGPLPPGQGRGRGDFDDDYDSRGGKGRGKGSAGANRGGGGSGGRVGDGLGAGPLADNPPSRTLWLRGVTTVHSEDNLWDFFERFGQLDCVKVLYAKGIAFINYMGVESAMRAKVAVAVEPVCGILLTHNYGKATPPPAAPTGRCSLGEHEFPSNIVWIGGLAPPLNERFLNKMFEGFPGLINVVAYEDKKIAFVNFQTIQAATVCRNALIGKPLAGVPVKVCYGKPTTPQVCAVCACGSCILDCTVVSLCRDKMRR